MIRSKLGIVLTAAALVFFLSATNGNVLAQAKSSTDFVLVLPFENCGEKPPPQCHVVDRPEYNWIGESFADSLSTLLNKPGLRVATNEERAVAYQRLRLPLTVLPSRATAIKIARELKASIVVVGTYDVTLPPPGDQTKTQTDRPLAMISGEARVILTNEGRMAGKVLDEAWAPRVFDFGGTITDLQKMHGDMTYEILYQREQALCRCERPPLPFSRNWLVQEATKVPSLAFEAYVKGVQTPESDPTREIFFKNALRLYAKEKPGAAYPEAAFQLGRFYLNQNHWKEAAEYFTMLQKREPHYGEAQFYAGLSYWKLGDLSHALDALVPLADEKVMPLVGVYNNAGAVSVEAARLEKKPEERIRLLTQGITLLSRAVESSPDDTMVLFNYAYALFLSDKYAEAAEKLQRVIAADPRDGPAFFLLAKAQERASHAEAAEAADNAARRSLPQAYAKWQTEWQKSQTVPGVVLRSRDVLNQIDISDLTRAREIEAVQANNAEEALNKIRDLYEKGQDDEALVEIQKLFNSEPTNAEAFLLRGRINQRRGDQETAIAALKTAIFWENDRPLIDAHILLGRIFLERGDLSEARKYAASAMSIDPNNQEAIALQRQVTMGRRP